MKALKQIYILFLFIPLCLFSQNTSIYNETFDTKTNWPEGSNESRELKQYNGRYYFEHKRTEGSWQVQSSPFKLDTNQDFEIETSIQKISGIENSGIAFLYDFKDSKNYKEFGFTTNGYFRVSESINNKYNNLKVWTKSDKVKTGKYSVNKLKIVKKGSTISFLINNSELHSMPFKDFMGDKIAVRLYKNQKISLDYISVKQTSSSNNFNNNNNNNNNNNSNTTTSILFSEDFSSNKNAWATQNNDEASLFFSNNKYYMEYKKDIGYTSTLLVSIDKSRDFKIETSIDKIAGVQNYGFGLIFGRTDGQNQNQFQISANGSFRILNYNKGTHTDNKAWTSSSAIKQGNYGTNILSVEKIANTYNFYINDVKVYTDNNIILHGDRQGFIVYQKQKIAVNYLKVSYLDTIDKDYDSNNLVVLNENFNDNKNSWSDSESDDYRFKVENGKLNMLHKKEELGYTTSINKYINSANDFEIDTKITKISGVDNYPFGLMWGGKLGNDFRFYVTSSGYYKIVRIVDNKEQIIKKWTLSSVINKNDGGTNRIKIKKENNNYHFYINNTFVDKTNFENFFGNEIGFVVYNKQAISVDYLKINYTKKAKNIIVNKKLDVPLRDNFNSNINNWYLNNNDDYSSSINGGQFVIHSKKNGVFIHNEVRLNDEKDFIIETSFSDKSANSSSLYGFTFGRKNTSNEYTFLLSSSGTYKFRKIDNDDYTELIKSSFSSAIKTGINATNILRIEKSGGLLRFYINNQYVNEAPFQSFFGDNIGYYAYNDKKIGVNYIDIKYRADNYNTPPIVEIISPNVEQSRGFKIVKIKQLEVRGIATDKDGIYEITVNGIEANVSENGNFTARVPLKYGLNELVVTATDLKQAKSTKKFNIKRTSEVINNNNIVDNNDDLGFITGKYYALIIGVSDYDVNSFDLGGQPTKDALKLADVLIKNYNFDSRNVVVLKDPTEDDINSSFIKMRSKVTNDDSVLIFYAGHGHYDEATERGFWMPSNFQPQFEKNVVLNSTVVDHIKTINSKHTLLIADACFSGSILTRSGYTSKEKTIKRFYELQSRKALTSGALKTVPNKSAFFKYLIKNLENNPDKYLSSRVLYDRIIEPVINLTENTPLRGKISNTNDEGGDFIFIKRN